MWASTLLVLSSIACAASTPFHNHEHRDEHSVHRRLPGSWHQPRDHSVHELFKRAVGDFSEVGSADWAKGYPDNQIANVAKIPQAWKDALDKAVSAGKIPNIPNSNANDGDPKYPNNLDPNSKTVCSSTAKCRQDVDYVIWDAPDGVWASSFDDGPQLATSRLVKFLDDNNVTTTHFLIGVNIVGFVDQFKEILQSGNDLAVHTWTHPYMTSLTNEEVVGQIGWTMQIIHDSTKGKVPKYWRPPYGDSDVRVAAIAKEVFGLTTVIWNQDTADWSIASGGTTEDKVKSDLEGWMAGSKKPGLMPLEHELTDTTVDAFMKTFPDIASHGWKFQSLASAYSDGPYLSDNDHLALFGKIASSSSSAAPTASSASSAKSASTPAAAQASASSSASSSNTNAATNPSPNAATSSSPVRAVIPLLFALPFTLHLLW
ncbi:carbohydrate esterase family 4 protein [Flagelloscypha sp. PMI_526]|nr:carbohydrate esterase family 4 protein [Flagelloscypha sp. PMI_526]